jgi:hypothetical protein
MAILGWRRVVEGTGFSGKVGEALRYDEAWLIRCSSPLDSKQAITRAVPCGWYAAHWENPACRAMEFKLSPKNQDGLLWRLDVAFYPPPPNRKIDDSTGIPEDFWERSGGTSTVPVFEDYYGAMIVNAAGDPIEGLQKEREEKGWTLTKYYTDDSWKDDAELYAGSTNSDSWAGGDPDTWKCGLRSAKRREIQNVSRGQASENAAEGEPVDGGDDDNLVVVETVWEFRYEPGTWKCMPWDVGFHELVGGERKAIVGADGKAVKQPVALNANGTKKSDGSPPSVIEGGAGVELYDKTTFAVKFGEPFIIPDPEA